MAKCNDCGHTFGFLELKKGVCKSCINKSKEDWENYNANLSSSDKPPSNKVPLNDNKNTNQSNNKNKGVQTVIISDINMPFGSMVVFIIKWALASIPAFLILAILFLIFGGTIATIFN